MPTLSTVLSPAVASFYGSADADLKVSNDSFTSGITPSRFATFSVDNYRIVNGMPFKEGNYGCAVLVECGVNSVSKPNPVEDEGLDLNFTAHWVPSANNLYVENVDWYPVKGSGVLHVSNNGAPSRRDFQYLSKRYYAETVSMQLANGDYFHTDDLSWNTQQSVAVTFVPNIQSGSETVILETNLAEDEIVENNESYVSVRYNNLGQVLLYVNKDLLWRTNTVYGYLSKPLIVALQVDAFNATVRLGVVDNSKAQFVDFNVNHPFAGRYYIGNTPLSSDAQTVINLLDVSYWGSNIGSAFDQYVLKLNQQYGVTL